MTYNANDRAKAINPSAPKTMLKEQLHKLSQTDRNRVIGQLRSALQNRAEIAFAYLYGSFADHLPFHDVDVGIYVHPKAEVQPETLALDLAESLSRAIHLPVDVRPLNRAPVSFSFHALRGSLLVDNDPDIRSEVTENIVARYLDMKPLLRRATKEAFVEPA